MIFSSKVLATDKQKTTLNWWEYWIGHCWMTGWQSMNHSFRNWADLMTGNWSDYALLNSDDPFDECYGCFWSYLGDDDVYPKEFLESLMQMSEDVRTGKVKTVPFTRDMFDKLDDLVGDMVELNLEEEFEDE